MTGTLKYTWSREKHVQTILLKKRSKIVLSQETMAVTTPVGLVRLKVRDEAPVM